MKILVTGASGFIGQYTLPLLISRGAEVHAISRSKRESNTGVTWHAVDLLDNANMRTFIKNVSPSHILHFAWDVTPGKYLHSTNNFRYLTATINLLEAFHDCGGRRIVTAGTCFEYDLNHPPFDEMTSREFPATLYGAAKLSIAHVSRTFSTQTGMTAAHGRIFYLYGPHEYPARLVPSVILSLLRGDIARCSHGNQIRDFMHVDDMARAFVELLFSDVSGIVNMGSGTGIPLKELIGEIGKQLNASEHIQLGAVDASNDPPYIVANTNRLRAEVGFQPTISLQDGIRQSIKWWKGQ